jgi:micrococcal nuclease
VAPARQNFGGLADRRQRRAGRRFGSTIAVILALGIGAAVTTGLDKVGLLAGILGPPVRIVAADTSQHFSLCSSAKRVNCVVDGDTFWLAGKKIRIADINTPEVGQPACETEAMLGRRASERLAELLSAAPFSLAAADRDRDQYGRALRIVVRDGRSIGDILVAEGLAQEWRGRREGWCG